MYCNTNAMSKQVARDKVLATSLGKNNPMLLSLPADNFIYEEMYRKQHPNSKIETVEYDPSVYKVGKKKAKELTIKHRNAEAFTYLSKNKKYDVIWLDLCGYLSPTIINNLIPVVQGRNTEKETILALTFMARREKLAKHMDVYGSKNLKQFRKKGFVDTLSNFASMNNCTVENVDFFTYKGDKSKSTTMNLYILKINKN